LESKSLDGRADLFSTAVVLYELFFGVYPFETGTGFEKMKKIAPGEVCPSSELRPDVPAFAPEALTPAPSVHTETRYVDAGEFRQALLAAQDPRWLAAGTEELARWLKELYPKDSQREEAPVEKTPLLSRTGTPLPIKIEATESLISGVAEISQKE